MDLVPKEIKSHAGYIETKLRLSGVKYITPLNKDRFDDRSSRTQWGFADTDDDILIISDDKKNNQIDPENMDEINQDDDIDISNTKNNIPNVKTAKETFLIGYDSEEDDDEDQNENNNNNFPETYLEDGFSVSVSTAQFSHDTDNLFAENLQESHSVQSALSLKEELNSIRSTFNSAEERMMEWNWNAEKEILLASPQPCFLNCGEYFTMEEMTSHLRERCPNRTASCHKCNLLIKEHLLKFHERKECTKRMIACPNVTKGCKQLVPFDYLDIHLNLKCKVRPMMCRQFCEVVLPLNMREDHEIYHCKNRKMNCDSCKEEMIAHEYTSHLHNKCPERIVHCKFACGRTFKARDVEKHEIYECVQPCKWKCGQVIGPREKLLLHEASECLLHPQECRHNCGTKNLTTSTIKEHENFQCRKRLVDCPFGCAATLYGEELTAHCDSWTGECPLRLVRCPSNMLGWRVLVLPNHLREGIVIQYKREKELKGAENKNDFYQVDKLCIKFPDKVEWVDFWVSKFVLLGKVDKNGPVTTEKLTEDDHFSCGWINCCDMNDHLNDHCLNRNVFIKGKNDVKTGNLVAASTYPGHKVAFKDVKKSAELLNDFDSFVYSIENPVNICCDFCSAEMPALDLEEHKRNECLFSLVRCPYGCGKTFPRMNLQVMDILLDK